MWDQAWARAAKGTIRKQRQAIQKAIAPIMGAKKRRAMMESLERRLMLTAYDLTATGASASANHGFTQFTGQITSFLTSETANATSPVNAQVPLVLTPDSQGNLFSPKLKDLLAAPVDLDGNGSIGGNETILQAIDVAGNNNGFVDLTEALNAFVFSPVEGKLAGGTSTGSLVSFLQNLNIDSSFSPALTLTADAASTKDLSTATQAAVEYKFTLTFQSKLPVDLGLSGDNEGLSFPDKTEVTVNSSATFDMIFGTRPEGASSTNADAFFYLPSPFQLGVDINETNRNDAINIGFLGGHLKNGSIKLNESVDVSELNSVANAGVLGFTSDSYTGTTITANTTPIDALPYAGPFKLTVGANGSQVNVSVPGGTTVANIVTATNNALSGAGFDSAVTSSLTASNQLRLTLKPTSAADLHFSAGAFDAGGKLVASAAYAAPASAVTDSFPLVLNGNKAGFVTVNIPSGTTLDNVIPLINTALSAAGLGSVVTAKKDSGGTKVELDSSGAAAGQQLEIPNTMSLDGTTFDDLGSHYADQLTAAKDVGSKYSLDLPITIDPGLKNPDGTDFNPAGVEVKNVNTDPFDPALKPANFDQVLRLDVPLNPINFGTIPDFKNVSAAGVIGVLGQLEGWLGSFQQSSLLSKFPIPFAKAAYSKVLDLATAIQNTLLFDQSSTPGTPRLQKPDPTAPDPANAQLVPVFRDAQTLASSIESVLSLSGADVKPTWDSVGEELTYNLSLSYDLPAVEVPIDFSLNFAPVGSIASNTTLKLSTTAGLGFTMGFNLKNSLDLPSNLSTALNDPVLNAGTPITSQSQFAVTAPNSAQTVYGRLGGDLSFQVKINGDLPVSVDVSQSTTQNNVSIADLVGDINAAISGGALAGKIVAQSVGGQILLVGIGSTTSFSVTASSSNVAVTQLGLVNEDNIGSAFSAASSLQLVAPTAATPTNGQLGSDAVFTITVGTNDPVTVMLGAFATKDNHNLNDLAADFNSALAQAGLSGDLTVGVNDTGTKLTLTALKTTGTIKVAASAGAAHTAMGFDTAAATLSSTLMLAGNTNVPSFVGLTADATLTVNGHVATVKASTTSDNHSILDLVADLNSALSTGGASGVVADHQGGQLILRSSSSFTVTASSSDPAVTQLGFDASATANKNDFVIQTQDGTKYNVSIAGATTLKDVADKISAATSGKVTVGLNPLAAGLQLTENGIVSDGITPFNVQQLNGSPAALELGIVGIANPLHRTNLSNTILVGNAIGTLTLADRFFVKDAGATGEVKMTAEKDFADLIIGADGKSLTSAAKAFGNLDIGSVIHITGGAGFTPGDYTIESISGNAAVLNAAVGMAGSIKGAGNITGISANATFGFVGIHLSGDGALDAKISATLGLKNRATNTFVNKVSLTQLYNALKQVQFTDLVIDGSNNKKVTSAAHPFDPVDVGQVIHITGGSGFTPGDYTIASVSGGAATLDKAIGTAGSTGGIGRIASGIANVSVKPSVTGTGSLSLGVSITPALTFINLGSTPTVTFNITDFGNPFASPPVPPTISFGSSGLADLFNYKNVSFSNIVDVIKAISSFLGSFQNIAILNNKIPVLNQSVDDLLSFADRFAQAVQDIQNDPAGALQGLESKLRQVFGIPDSVTNFITFSMDGSVLKMELKLGAAFNKSLNVNVGLGNIGGNIANLSGSAGLNASGNANLDLTVGVDTSDPTKIYLYPTTGLTAGVHASGSNITFRGTIGPLGVYVTNGSAKIDLTAGLTASFAGKTLISDVIGNLAADFGPTLDAKLDVTLPVFFPTESTFLGNVAISGEVTDPTKLDLSNFTVTLPDISTLTNLFSNFNPEQNLLLMVDGLDTFLGGLQDVLNGQVLGLKLPLIGNKLASAAQFVGNFRKTFIDQLRNQIENAVSPDQNLISQTLFQVFGPSGLQLLQDTNHDGNITAADVKLTTNLNDPGVTLSNAFFEWNLGLGQTYMATADIGLDLGIPGLGLSTSGGVSLSVGWGLDLDFGINFADGFFIDTSKTDANLDIKGGLPNAKLTGRLAFLQLDIADNPANPSDLEGKFKIALTGGDADHHLSFGNLGTIGVDATVGAVANIDLNMKASLNNALIPASIAAVFPTVDAEFILNWGLGTDIDHGVALSGIPDGIVSGLKLIEFKGVSLDLGSFVSNVIEPIIAKVQSVTEPIQPLIDVLTARIPVISDLAGQTITLLDIAAAFGDVDAGLIQSIKDIADLVTFFDGLHFTAGAPVLLPFGDFTLFDSSNPSGVTADKLADPTFNFNSSAGMSALPTPTNPSFDLSAELGSMGGSDEVSAVSEITSPKFSGSFDFPILKDPSQVFGLLLGRPATLVTYTMAPLVVNFSYTQYFPIFGPLGAALTGQVGVTINLGFGYDTQGIAEFAQGGFKDPSLLFDGFYVSDVDKDGNVVPQVVLTGGISAAAEINLGIAQAGASGGIFVEVDFTLYDPNHDGKVRISELVSSFENEAKYGDPVLAPLAIFDVSGKIYAQLSAFLKINLFFFKLDKSFNITPEITLATFELNFARPPVLANIVGGDTLQLNMGPNSGQRVNGDTTDGNEDFHVKRDGNNIDVWSPELGIPEDKPEVYDGTNIDHIIALGGEGNDTIDIEGFNGSDVSIEASGGDGNDTITVTGSKAVVHGNKGDDIISGTDGPDLLFGDEGNDSINGNGGRDIIFGDGGQVTTAAISSLISPTDGNDTVSGGDGGDVIIGAGGDDQLSGDGGKDIILGDGGQIAIVPMNGFVVGYPNLDLVNFDQITIPANQNTLNTDPVLAGITNTSLGKGGNDKIDGGDDDDIAFGGTGNDTFTMGAGNDIVFGEAGFDSIDGGSGNDVISGGADNDTVNAGADDDLVYGDGGADVIHGNDGKDTVYGGTGPDTIFGDAGDDLLHGESDPDVIFGGADNDSITGDAGNDIIFGDDGLVATLGNNAGSTADDTFVGIGATSRLIGFTGDGSPLTTDLVISDVVASDGNDSINGGSDDDIVIGGGGADKIFGDVDSTAPFAVPSPTGSDILIGDGGFVQFGGDFGRKRALISTIDDSPLGGDDSIYGNNGNDVIMGGFAGDHLYGGMGPSASTDAGAPDNDVIIGDNGEVHYDHAGVFTKINTINPSVGGDDVIAGNEGDDSILAGFGNDTANGNVGNDIIIGDNGEIDFTAGVRTSIFTTNEGVGGVDNLSGDDGNDVIMGGAAGDNINGNAGNDVLIGDEGRADYTSDGANITTLKTTDTSNATGGIDNINGNTGNDVILGGVQGDNLNGNENNDILLGDEGELDYNLGGPGFDSNPATLDKIVTTSFTLGGNDQINGGDGSDTALGGTGNDTINGEGVVGATGNDVLLGDQGEIDFFAANITRIITTDVTAADGGVDTVNGNAGNDTILGGVAGDILNGNDGNDVILGDEGQLQYNLTGTFDGNPLTVDNIETLQPSLGGSDIIQGNAGADIAFGGAAGDTIYGDAAAPVAALDGNDILFGDGGRMAFFNGAVQNIRSTDTAIGGSDYMEGNAGADIMLGGAFSDEMHGDAGTNASINAAADGNDIMLGDNGLLDWLYHGSGLAIEQNFTFDNDISTLDLVTTIAPNDGAGDLMFGNAGSDVMFGGTGSDLIVGDNTKGAVGSEAFGTPSARPGNDLEFGDHGRIYPQNSFLGASFPSRNFFSIDTGFASGGAGDSMFGNENDDIMIGGQGDDLMYGQAGDDDMIGGHNVAGGIDELKGPAGTSVNDQMDGGTGNDVIAGDNATIWRNGTAIQPNDLRLRFRTLNGSLLFTAAGTPNITAGGHNDPRVTANRSVFLLDHDTTVQSADANSLTGARFGNDNIAGNAGDDAIFGELGNDMIQGDGRITETTLAAGVSPNTMIYEGVNAATGVVTDGNDYIEGNGGTDMLIGNLGQDDIIGGSSQFFGLTTAAQRPDGGDVIFGGAANPDRVKRLAFTGDVANDTITFGAGLANRHAVDSDFILGDNGDIYRIVTDAGLNGSGGATSFVQFNYDQTSAFENRGTVRIVVRAYDTLDYSPIESVTTSIGGADVIHGESGDDFIHGETGNDFLYGDGENDEMFGERGDDWMSGGTGDDAMLGDNGLVKTSRNSIAEPLYGIIGTTQLYISEPGDFLQYLLNPNGVLKHAVDLEPFDQGGNDIMYGGLGDDEMHGGFGDDGISGAEALPQFYNAPGFAQHVVTGDLPEDKVSEIRIIPIDGNGQVITGFYDQVNSLPKLANFYLNFENDLALKQEIGAHFDPNHGDGKDFIFGDWGNDWLVGGTGRDHVYGGMGADIINLDDDLETDGGLNDQPDFGNLIPGDPGAPAQVYDNSDFAYGGGGRDLLIGNTGADRMEDWVGEYNDFVVPFAPFGNGQVERKVPPSTFDFFYQMSESDGADQTRVGALDDPAGQTGDPATHGEPFAEMGLVTQKDKTSPFAWGDQNGAPADKQAGNTPGGKRDTRGDGLSGGTTNTTAVTSATVVTNIGTFKVTELEFAYWAKDISGISNDTLANFASVLASDPFLGGDAVSAALKLTTLDNSGEFSWGLAPIV